MLDIIVILIILGSALIGAKMGFIRTVYQLLSSIIALVVAVMIYPMFESILKITPFYGTINQWIEGILPTIESSIGLQAQSAIIEEATTWLPQFVTDYIIANNNSEVYNLLGVSKLRDYIVVSLSNLVIAAIAILIAWIVVKIVLAVGVSVLDIVSKLPLLRTANSIAGFGAGAVKGLLFIWLICFLIPLFVLIPEFKDLELLIQQSFIAKMLYENNLILQMLWTF